MPSPIRQLWQHRPFAYFMTMLAFYTLAGRMMVVALGYHAFSLTHDPKTLGLIGLIEAIPVITFALLGGFVADRLSLTKILPLTCVASFFIVGSLASLTFLHVDVVMQAIFTAAFCIGVVAGFFAPARVAMEAQVLPKSLLLKGSSILSTTWLVCAIVGPGMAGFIIDHLGMVSTYGIICLFFGGALILSFTLPRHHVDSALRNKQNIFQSVGEGLRFVWGNQVLLGAMALDLFAVLFGGMIALLPAFAEQVFNVGARGLGLMESAPMMGALMATIWTSFWLPQQNTGLYFMAAVFGFGLSIIFFAFAPSFAWAIVALILTGVFDGISMVIRRLILRLYSPDHMRGRIASVSSIFIGASNELGAFESGFAAKAFGLVRSVWMGGVVTLVVAGTTFFRAPKLRDFSLEEKHDRI